jgi:hypothetical protein
MSQSGVPTSTSSPAVPHGATLHVRGVSGLEALSTVRLAWAPRPDLYGPADRSTA